MTSAISEIIRNRRTIHNFQPNRLPPQEEILTAFEHAIWAPNHHATEPWRFYLIGDGTKEKICRLNADLIREIRGDEAAGIKLKRWLEIPGWFLLSCQESKNKIRAIEDYAACCCAAQNVMLYLWSKGIGVKWSTGSVIRNRDFFSIVGIDPEQEKIVGLFWYGYPEEIPQASRLPVEDKLTVLP